MPRRRLALLLGHTPLRAVFVAAVLIIARI